jgi:phage shock protein A
MISGRRLEETMFRRIANLFKGFLGLFVSGMERRNPEALLEVEQENLREQIGRYNQGLASHAGLCERLMTQVKRQEAEERDLRAKATANLKAGNRDVAGQYALRLQSLTNDLADNREQLKQAEETYKNLLKARDVAITAARAKIEALKSGINDMKMKQAMAELTEMSAGMISNIGGAGDTLDRLQTMVEEERNKAAGRARLAKDSIDVTEVKIKEGEQQALADQALADFAAKEGITLDAAPGTPATPQTAKQMGPVAENP